MSRARLVSVIVPSCNRPAELRLALASIRALEGPDLTFEILVGDNGVSPQTRAIAEAAGARWIAADGAKGASVGRNAAMKAASGEFIAFLDDDDVWRATHLRAHIAFLDANPACDAVMGQIINTDHNLRPLGEAWPDAQLPGPGPDLVRLMLSGFFPQIGSVVARACVRERYGYFNEKLIGGEDLDWLLRIARPHKLGFVAVESVLFRQRPPGSYDQLQLIRVGYDRLVFLRHALAEWRLWRSPGEFLNAYYGSLQYFYAYFTETARARATRGERLAALRAASCAFYVFPLRAAYHMIAPKPLRAAVLAALAPQRRKRASTALTSGFVALSERMVPIVEAVAVL